MRLLAIDPSSTVLGWCVLEDDKLGAYGLISTKKVPYERRFMHISQELNTLFLRFGFEEVACERAIRFNGRQVAALEVAVATIKKWAKGRKWTGGKEMPISFYSPGEWKVTIAGAGNADKAAVARVICLQYRQLPADVSDHITDAIGIGQHHQTIKKLERMSR